MIKILVCDPSYYNVTYSINPWMRPNEIKIDRNLAVQQWYDLVNLLKALNVEVSIMPGQPKLPDMVFTANAGLIIFENILINSTLKTKKVVLSNFKYKERKNEKIHYKEWFENNGYEEVFAFNSDCYFEGAGDGLFDESKLYLGYGFRSSYECANHKIWKSIFPNIEIVKLIDPYFYHLDTCFCPLQNNYALIYPGAFESETLENEFDELELLKVPEEDARKFACNAISIGNKVVIPSGCKATKKLLESAAFEVYETDMSEFIKSGGACKCLTLRLI